ncbi:MAG: hypothetical protein ABSF26_01310 [Thermoguttaceae bacterium]
MANRLIRADARYVHTLEFLDQLPDDEGSLKEGEYQRLTADDRIQYVRHTIEEYPTEITLLNELGNDAVKFQTWLVPGKRGIFGILKKQIKLKEISSLKMDNGVSLIAVRGEIHELNMMVDKFWFYESGDRFMCIPYREEAAGRITFEDDSISRYFWQTIDEKEAEARLRELHELLVSGKAKFLFGNQNPATGVITVSDGRVISMDKGNLTPPADFDSAFYLREYPDVAAHPYFGEHPYEHYVYCGKTENRRTHAD